MIPMRMAKKPDINETGATTAQADGSDSHQAPARTDDPGSVRCRNQPAIGAGRCGRSERRLSRPLTSICAPGRRASRSQGGCVAVAEAAGRERRHLPSHAHRSAPAVEQPVDRTARAHAIRQRRARRADSWQRSSARCGQRRTAPGDLVPTLARCGPIHRGAKRTSLAITRYAREWLSPAES